MRRTSWTHFDRLHLFTRNKALYAEIEDLNYALKDCGYERKGIIAKRIAFLERQIKSIDNLRRDRLRPLFNPYQASKLYSWDEGLVSVSKYSAVLNRWIVKNLKA